jgi:hypothetical protein
MIGSFHCPKPYQPVSMAADEFAETAGVAALGLVLMEKGQPVVFEDPEELIPGYLLEFFLRLAEIDAKNATIPGVSDPGRMAVAGFHPSFDLAMIGRHVR